MPRITANRLTARTVAALKDGVFGDGGNLWLTVKGNTRAWSVRFKSPVTGKAREMGIGSSRDISLAEAREKAAETRALVRKGVDPIDIKRAERASWRKEKGLTFEQVAGRYIKERSPGWSNERSAEVWTSSLLRDAYPFIGERPVDAIETDDVLAVLRPIWEGKTETAARVRGRIERILDYATTHGWRTGENPARWRGHLENILPAPSKVAKVQHYAAVHRANIPAVMAALKDGYGVGSLAARFVCLTAARSGEVRAAVWSEIDLTAKTWTVAGEKMKGGREHRVPLSSEALAVLEAVKPLRDRKFGDLIFPGARRGRPLSDVAVSKALHVAAGTKDVTVHGLRSTFRDWAAEETDYPNEVAEMALAHVINNKVEAAYRRGDLFDKRRQMMDEWCAFVTEKAGSAQKAA